MAGGLRERNKRLSERIFPKLFRVLLVLSFFQVEHRLLAILEPLHLRGKL